MEILCPQCRSTVPSISADTRPTHCPSCGVRITCPKCGSVLEPDPSGRGPLQCSGCGVGVPLTVTLRDSQTCAASSDGAEATVARPSTMTLPGFEILGELGRGGMGVVYRARQISLNREVAIKVLPPAVGADPHMLARFRNEAAAAARITDAHVLPVFEVIEHQGAPLLILPLIDGSNLRDIIRDRRNYLSGTRTEGLHPWAYVNDQEYLQQMLPVLDQVIDSVTAIHLAGVIHRDIKSSNVLVDRHGNAWVGDFGLARLRDAALLTQAGHPIGTPAYMSPEQRAGLSDVDERSDLFSLGATLYEALTLELPFGREGVKRGDVPPQFPSRWQRLLSRDYDAVVLKAMELDRAARYQTATELRDDWRRVRQGLMPRARRASGLEHAVRRLRPHVWRLATAALLLVTVALAAVALQQPSTARTVRVVTDPPGARVVLVPIDVDPWDAGDGEPIAERAIRPPKGKTTPLTIENVPPGEYLLVAEVPDHGFHEVYRVVPPKGDRGSGDYPHTSWTEAADGTVEIPSVRIPQSEGTNGMVHFKGGTFTMGSQEIWESRKVCGPHKRFVAAFYLDPTEVSNEQYKRFADPTRHSALREIPDNHPVANVTWDDAASFAESVGKRLPTEVEYEFAATNAGTTVFPWGDATDRVKDWSFGPLGEPKWDRTATEPPVYGLFSNVAEWTSSWQSRYPHEPIDGAPPWGIEQHRDSRIVRGGPAAVVFKDFSRHTAHWQYRPHWRGGWRRHHTQPGLGFRCARSAEPRFVNEIASQ